MNESDMIIEKWQVLIKACIDYYINHVPTGLSDTYFDELEKAAWEQDQFNARLYVFENYSKGTKVQNNYIEKINKTKVLGMTMMNAISDFQKNYGKKVYADLKYDGSSIAIYVDPTNGKPLQEVTVGNIHTVDRTGGAEPGIDQTWKLHSFLPPYFPKGIVAIQAEALIDYTRLDNPETARQRANGLINSKYCDTSLLTLRAYRYYTDDSPAGLALRNMDYREVLSSFEIVRDNTGYIKFAPADIFTVSELSSCPDGYTESDHTITSTGSFLNDGWVMYDEHGTCLGALKFAGAGSSSESVIKTTARGIIWNNNISKGKDSWSANIEIDPVTVKGVTIRKPSAGSIGKLVSKNITPGAEVSIILANSTIPMIGEVFSPGNSDFSWPRCSCGWQLSEKDVFGSLLKCGNPNCTERLERMRKYLSGVSRISDVDLNVYLVIDRFKWENTSVDLGKIEELVKSEDKNGFHDYLLGFMTTDLQKRTLELVWQPGWEALYEKIKER